MQAWNVTLTVCEKELGTPNCLHHIIRGRTRGSNEPMAANLIQCLVSSLLKTVCKIAVAGTRRWPHMLENLFRKWIPIDHRNQVKSIGPVQPILFTLALILSRGVIKNKRQSLVTTSPAEAEYQAARLKGAIPCLSYTDSPVNHPCPTTEACQSNDRMPSWFLS